VKSIQGLESKEESKVLWSDRLLSQLPSAPSSISLVKNQIIDIFQTLVSTFLKGLKSKMIGIISLH
jgi:hypothetical protein